MVRAVALLSLISAGSATAAEVALDERPRVGVLIVNPTPALAQVRVSDVHATARAVLRGDGELTAIPFEGSIEDCGTELHCWVDRAASATRADFVLIISVRSQMGSPDNVIAMLLDATDALKRIRSIPTPRPPDHGIRLDADLLDHSLLARHQAPSVRSVEELEHAFAALAASASAELSKRSAWRSVGALDLDLTVSGAAIAIDAAPVAVSSGETIHISGIRHGKRTVGVEHPDYFPTAAAVDIQGDTTSQLRIELKPRSVPLLDRVQPNTWWVSGVALAASIGFATYGIVHTSGTEFRCAPLDGGTTCPQVGYLRLFPSGDEIRADGRPPSAGSGPLILPLALALGGASASTWITDAILAPDSDGDGWLPLVLGAAVGVVAYSAGELVNLGLRD